MTSFEDFVRSRTGQAVTQDELQRLRNDYISRLSGQAVTQDELRSIYAGQNNPTTTRYSDVVREGEYGYRPGNAYMREGEYGYRGSRPGIAQKLQGFADFLKTRTGSALTDEELQALRDEYLNRMSGQAVTQDELRRLYGGM